MTSRFARGGIQRHLNKETKFWIWEVTGILSVVYMLGGMFVCAQGWLDGRWMLLFVTLPFVAFAIPDTVRCEGLKGVAKLALFSLVFVGSWAVVVMVAGAVFQSHWLRIHQWIVLPAYLLAACLVMRFLGR